jgi:hypothetical protein
VVEALSAVAERSLREIARELMAMDYTNKGGDPYSASCVKSMVDGRALNSRKRNWRGYFQAECKGPPGDHLADRGRF